MARVYDLDLDFVAISPRIWRRIRIPALATLTDLHHVIQAVLGWEDHHLHLFEVAGREFGVPPDEEWEREEWDAVDESTVKLSKALSEAAGTFDYVYDFGSDWRLTIRLIDDSTVPGPPRAECLAGERAAPPEHTGGAAEYQKLIDAWAQSGGQGLSDQLRDWLPARFDPQHFDLPAANRRLRAAEATEPAEPAPSFADAGERLLADVTLLALHLGSWEESSGRHTAWKTLRFEVLDVLKREGLIDTTPARKSVVITERGWRRAEGLRARLARFFRAVEDW